MKKTNLTRLINSRDLGSSERSESNIALRGKAKKVILSITFLLLIAALIIMGRNSDLLFSLPSVSSYAGSGLVFLSGLIAGVHCVGMCGSFILTYVSRDTARGAGSFKSHINFSAGKIVSYTLIGAAFGAAGSLFTITPFIGGLSVSIAGFFLLVYGISMLGIFNLFGFLKIKQPEFLNRFIWKAGIASWHPLLLGLTSGLLIGCGPLQAMYILAAGTASMIDGAMMLFLFAAGTLPALLAFAFITRKLSASVTRELLKFAGIIIIILGIMMFNKGIRKIAGSGNSTMVSPACDCMKAKTDNHLIDKWGK